MVCASKYQVFKKIIKKYLNKKIKNLEKLIWDFPAKKWSSASNLKRMTSHLTMTKVQM
jgi:hypothetical protein